MRATPWLTIGLVWLALIAAGCGDDENAAEPRALTGIQTTTLREPGPQRTPEERAQRRYLLQLDEICQAADRALKQAELQEFGPAGSERPEPTRAERQRFLDEVIVPARRGQLATIERVSPGSPEAAAMSGYFAAFEEATGRLGATLALIRDPGIEDEAFARAESLADTAGLTHCGTG